MKIYWKDVFWNVLLLVCMLACIAHMQSCTPQAATNKELGLTDIATDTTKVVIVVIDGPRYIDTWGTQGQPLIPYMADSLLHEGTFFSNFKNNKHTYTLAGHTALVTGNYQLMSNDGSEAPKDLSIFHHYLMHTANPPAKAAIVTSKSKLHVLARTKNHEWEPEMTPFTNCGRNGEDRSDAETFAEVVQTLKTQKPNLLLVQFKGPDSNAHANNWEGYISSIQETDSLVYQLWKILQSDKVYQNNTAFLITNDHGRHVDGHKNGFVSHGDQCEGCKHISLLALGPDFSKDRLVTEEYELVDIAPTVAALLGLKVQEYDEGKQITPLLEKKKREERISLEAMKENQAN